ncbi:YwpF family protein [Bacillus sp. FJAT-44742]|uniref:YwpF family protein n=1 Tax=Bacillus sp. FJAT-44742 TaxID=2014005 RepID=UPI000C242D86|nr:YwpF family protein [Bacillus sp. FJAT-44742]
MKTFRLVAMQLVLSEEDKIIQEALPLQDGLIINREEKNSLWLIEAVIPKEKQELFEKWKETQEKFVVEVTITDERNDPATMTAQVRDVITLSNSISVLFDGKMAVQKDDVFNVILEGLIEDGFSGENLLEEFKNRKEDQGSWSHRVAENLYKEVKGERSEDSRS